MKKFISLVLALVMALSLTTIAWGAPTAANCDNGANCTDHGAAIGADHYATLADAVADVAVGGTATITLLKSHSGAGIFLGAADKKNITIDFATYTYTCNGPAVGSAGYESQAFHLEKNNTVKMMNGTVTSVAGSGVVFLVQNYCDLTLDGMKLDGTNLDGSPQYKYTLSNNCGNVVIDDTTITAAAGGVAFDVCDYADYTGVSVTVTGNSEINGKIELSDSKTADKDVTKLVIEGGAINGKIVVATAGMAEDVTISGGTFTVAPKAAYVAKGYAVKKTGTVYEVYKQDNKDAATTTTTTSGTTTTVEDVVTNSSAPTVIDVSVAENTTKVEMNVAAAAKVFNETNAAAAKPVEIVTADASVTFDKAAAAKIAANKTAGAAVTLTVDVEEAPAVADVEPANTNAFNAVMANAGVANTVLVSLKLTDNTGNALFSQNNAAGTADVKVKLPAGLNTAKLYYLDGDTSVYMGAYSADANGYISVVLEHFSQYVIVGGTSAAADAVTAKAYKMTSNGTLVPGDVNAIYAPAVAAVLNDDGKQTNIANIAHYTFSGSTCVVAASLADADFVLYSDAAGKNVMMYLKKAVVSYNGTGTVFTNFGKACGQVTYTAETGKTYYTTNANGDAGIYVADKEGTKALMVGGKLVLVNAAPVANLANAVKHAAVPTVKDGKITGYTCATCKLVAVEAPNFMSIPKGATVVTGNWYWPVAVASTPSTDKVESAETFDAGIAMYVGMSVMAAAGSAVVLKKKD